MFCGFLIRHEKSPRTSRELKMGAKTEAGARFSLDPAYSCCKKLLLLLQNNEIRDKFKEQAICTTTDFCSRLYKVMILLSGDQPQSVQDPGVVRAGGNQVDAGGLDGAVAQHVRQLCYVPADVVKGPGEQVPQVVGKHLAGRYPRLSAQPLHALSGISRHYRLRYVCHPGVVRRTVNLSRPALFRHLYHIADILHRIRSANLCRSGREPQTWPLDSQTPLYVFLLRCRRLHFPAPLHTDLQILEHGTDALHHPSLYFHRIQNHTLFPLNEADYGCR